MWSQMHSLWLLAWLYVRQGLIEAFAGMYVALCIYITTNIVMQLFLTYGSADLPPTNAVVVGLLNGEYNSFWREFG